jgi:hypothetical protein
MGWLRAFALFGLLLAVPFLLERLLSYHTERQVSLLAYSGFGIVILSLIGSLVLVVMMAKANPGEYWFGRELQRLISAIKNANNIIFYWENKSGKGNRWQLTIRIRKHPDQSNDEHTVLTMRYLKYNQYQTYAAVVLILIASLCAIMLGIDGGAFVVLFAVPLLLNSLLTDFRVKKGYFGLNADEALELISFLNKKRSKNGPTTPFLSEDEIKNVISEIAHPAVQVQP